MSEERCSDYEVAWWKIQGTRPRLKTFDELFWEHFIGELQDANEQSAAKKRAIPPEPMVLICRGVDLEAERKVMRGP